MFIWPSAPVLAQFIWHFKDQFRNKTIIELGCGTSLPGIVACKIGAKVTFTDGHNLTNCLDLCKKNVEQNQIDDYKIMPLTWGHFDQELVELNHFDLIISSDCFYDQKDFEDILVTVSYLIDKHPNKTTVFYTSYQERCSDWSIECLLDEYNLKCEYINLHQFHADSDSIAGSNLPGRHTIHLFKIIKK